MLEIKSLTKTYKPKKGVPVKALDGVTLNFPDRGMVFLLGKSGSGKSTLLNLLGGLDRYDGGEIIIKGVSSKDFSQSHFDSYRNTYVGFIFQEYNILEEFSVGANIALAIELQGQKATDKRINEILHEVDLDGYAQRKPSELSGGQKQRVAIARALIKNPQIIMADEPTGALDSATGRQVLDTLKKLSREKLVIVVSHDRDFAERYADRIIELADGKVISDIEFFDEDGGAEQNGLRFEGEVVSVPAGYRLTEEDRAAINEYIDSLKSGVRIDMSRQNEKRASRAVDNSKVRRDRTDSFKLIKSKLPMKNAFKIGASSLKHKKIRLVITILLSCIAFGLFGLSDMFGAYDHIRTCTNSIIDTGITYASLEKEVRHYFSEDSDDSYFSGVGTKMSDDEIKNIEEKTGVPFRGVYNPYENSYSLTFDDNVPSDAEFTETDYDVYAHNFSGFIDIDSEFLSETGCEIIAGELPDGQKNELAISKYVAETFVKGGYVAKGDDERQKISAPEEMLGKTLFVCGREYTVTAVIDTKLDLDRYLPLTESKTDPSPEDYLVDILLSRELYYVQEYSLAQAIMVGEGHTASLIPEFPSITSLDFSYADFELDLSDGSTVGIYAGSAAGLDGIPDGYITWVGTEKKELADDEIIVGSDILDDMLRYSDGAYDDLLGASDGEDDGSQIYSLTREERYKKIIENAGALSGYIGSYFSNDPNEYSDFKIVGYIDSDKYNMYHNVVMSDKNLAKVGWEGDGIYYHAVGPMPEDRREISELVSFAYDESGDVKYPLMNSVTYELDTVNSALKAMSVWFLYIGIGFALFAAAMLANFISTSISYKKQEIGILRAIGSRSNDVFRIFFSESFIIALINFVLSSVGVALAALIINRYLRMEVGVYITIVSFGIRQALLLLLVSLVTAALASFIPVKRIASKRPIDAIRNR